MINLIGAVNAMQDTITLANWINVLPPMATIADIEKVFEGCYQERYLLAVMAFEASQLMSKMIYMAKRKPRSFFYQGNRDSSSLH